MVRLLSSLVLRFGWLVMLLIDDGVLCDKSRTSIDNYLNTTWIGKQSRPPVPEWPDQFVSEFYVYVEIYGKDFRSDGAIFYDWTKKTFRGDYYDWCLPLFDSNNTNKSDNYYTCSFLATEGNMYFVNHTAANGKWENNKCCLFAEDLGALPPDWMKAGQYNGTDSINDTLVDVWWFPGTSDPNKPCYGYWSAEDSSKRPVQFFGLSSLGPTILDYYTFTKAPPNVPLTKPNSGCDEQCKPSLLKSQNFGAGNALGWPNWPHC